MINSKTTNMIKTMYKKLYKDKGVNNHTSQKRYSRQHSSMQKTGHKAYYKKLMYQPYISESLCLTSECIRKKMKTEMTHEYIARIYYDLDL